MKTSKVIVTGIIFLFASCFLWVGFYYNVTFYGKTYAQSIPTNIKGMVSKDIPMDQHTLDILETSDVLFREYTAPGEPPYYLTIIFSENNRKVAHPPELCLSGGGNTVEEKKQIEFDTDIKKSFDAQRLIVNHGYNKWMYLYWYKTGNLYSSHYMLQQLLASVTQLFYRKSSCALIRISMPIAVDEDPPYSSTEAKLVDFAKEVVKLTAKHLP